MKTLIDPILSGMSSWKSFAEYYLKNENYQEAEKWYLEALKLLNDVVEPKEIYLTAFAGVWFELGSKVYHHYDLHKEEAAYQSAIKLIKQIPKDELSKDAARIGALAHVNLNEVYLSLGTQALESAQSWFKTLGEDLKPSQKKEIIRYSNPSPQSSDFKVEPACELSNNANSIFAPSQLVNQSDDTQHFQRRSNSK